MTHHNWHKQIEHYGMIRVSWLDWGDTGRYAIDVQLDATLDEDMAGAASDALLEAAAICRGWNGET